MTKRWSMMFVAVGLFSLCLAHGAEKDSSGSNVKIDGKAVTLARYAKAFIGAGNVKVDVAPYKSGDHEGAILFFHGIESSWDGKAINHRVETGSRGVDYVTSNKGKDWHTLITRQDEEGKTVVELYVPDVKEAISLVPSDGEAQLTNPRAIFQAYEDQRK